MAELDPVVPPRIQAPAHRLGRFAFMARFLRNPLEVIPAAAYEEDFVAIRGGRIPRAWVTAPALVRAVLIDERDKFCKRTQIRLLGPLLGKGILTSEGAEWRWQRRTAAPMFRAPDLGGFVPAFVRAAQARIETWRRAGAESTQPMEAEMTRTTFDVIAATLLPSRDATLAPAIHEAVATLNAAGGWDVLFASMNLPQWLPHPGIVSSARAMRALRAKVATVIDERRASLAAEGFAPTDLTQRLIAARDPETGEGMSDERLVDNVLTFYLAGHETTAKALTWTLYLLALAPHWARRLEDEIAEVAGSGELRAEHIERLVLTQQVIRESMRLYPPVPIISRQALGPVRLGDHDIAAGTSVLLPVYAIHRHSLRWENPHAFLPERFAPGRESAMARGQYMPFGAGPRVCIGMSFAMLEATVVLATLLQHARFAPVEGEVPVPVARVTLSPKGGMPLRVRLRPALV